MFRASFWLALLLFAAPGLASATSHFTITNNSSKVKVKIYDGNDSECLIEAKDETVESGETKSMSCTGGGKQRCKVALSLPSDEDAQPCVLSSSLISGCGTLDVTIIPDGETLVIEGNSNYCSLGD